MLRLIIFLVGIVTGYLLRHGLDLPEAENNLPKQSGPSHKKQANLKRLMELFSQKRRVTNTDAVDLLGVSPKTARNYFDELEAAGLIKQHGSTGRDVFYTFNDTA